MFCTSALYISLPALKDIPTNNQIRHTDCDKSHPKKAYQTQSTRRCLTKMSNDSCKTCLNGWSGKDCGIPPHPSHVTITERDEPCYIVQATIVNHEIDILKLKIDNSLPYTDELIVIEGDKTFALEPKSFYVKTHEKELSSLIKLRQLHVHIKTTNKHSWDVQNEMRLVLQQFPISDWSRMGYIFVRILFLDSVLYNPSSFGTIFQSPLDIRGQPKTWTIPKGGWHCRWCFTIEDIQFKLKSSPYVDLPRIADNPEMMKPYVIYDHILKGKWFLGKKRIPRIEPQDIPINTPIYLRSYDWWIKHPPRKTA
ncbi:unnamed protein product [Mytilus edulis]|uniref:Uncharacterized protein n=1 Tax=Mytilus edulis TaxID=6550 RepID=A0A8S3URZ2_MYTED|nr:unnamed protein product [Mytilus edulis]